MLRQAPASHPGWARDYYICWTHPNVYQNPPNGDLPNDPWFPRIGFGIMPWAPEWAKQLFNPQSRYLLATWVPGKVRSNKGLLYNWKYHQFVAIDPFLARVQVSVTLDPTDICYGFYSYQEPDIVFTGLDINPFTNQAVRNRIVQFYFKNDGADHYHTIFWQILNTDGTVYTTNDPDQTLGTPHIFGSMVIGASRGVQSFQTADIRNRGGGLADEWQAIPEAINFWDLGSLDGKPYPLGGGLAVYLPAPSWSGSRLLSQHARSYNQVSPSTLPFVLLRNRCRERQARSPLLRSRCG